MRNLLRKVHAFFVTVVLHRFLVPLSLLLLYFGGFGVMAVLLRIRHAFRRSAPEAARRSNWHAAAGYEYSPVRIQRQS